MLFKVKILVTLGEWLSDWEGLKQSNILFLDLGADYGEGGSVCDNSLSYSLMCIFLT